MTEVDKDQSEQAGDAEVLGFEDAFRHLAEIAERLEAGRLTLAEATARYEQGMKLVQRCNQLLDSAELEITTLRDSYQRSAVAAPAASVDGPSYFDEAPYEDVGGEEDELPF
jgi:exodeoxyribonuclease VII small subunit